MSMFLTFIFNFILLIQLCDKKKLTVFDCYDKKFI